jgi:argonaute-like protein implicated in RNA metabolism and viral defense
MRLNLFFFILFFCAITKAQNNSELKDFIIKNSVALKAVQKNMVRDNNSNYTASFKEILKKQESSVKLYNTDKKASMYFAYAVRTECLAYLKEYTKGSTVYYEISELENSFVKSSNEEYSKVLSESELNSIDSIDAMNPQSLNNLTLTIQ